jgi:hypothetical protein
VNGCDPDPEAVPSPVRAVIPLPLDVGTEQLTLEPLTAHVQFVLPLGAAGVVPFRFGLLTVAPLTLIEVPPPDEVCGFSRSQPLPLKITSARHGRPWPAVLHDSPPAISPVARGENPGALPIVNAPNPFTFKLGVVVVLLVGGENRTRLPTAGSGPEIDGIVTA